MIFIPFILIVLSGVFNAIQDTTDHHYGNSIFNSKRFSRKYWDASISWMNKYLIFPNIENKLFRKLLETWLVFITDAWHLFKTLTKFFYMLGFASYVILIQFYGLEFNWNHLIFLIFADEIGFTPFYHFILLNNKKQIIKEYGAKINKILNRWKSNSRSFIHRWTRRV